MTKLAMKEIAKQNDTTITTQLVNSHQKW